MIMSFHASILYKGTLVKLMTASSTTVLLMLGFGDLSDRDIYASFLY